MATVFNYILFEKFADRRICILVLLCNSNVNVNGILLNMKNSRCFKRMESRSKNNIRLRTISFQITVKYPWIVYYSFNVGGPRSAV